MIAFIRHASLNAIQARFDALDYGAELSDEFGPVLGDHPTFSFLMLKPSAEADPEHRQKYESKDCLDQQRFLEGEDIDNAVLHINLRICTDNRAYITNVVI